jgi:hypothetical protein
MWHLVTEVADHNFLNRKDFCSFAEKSPEKYGLIEMKKPYTGAPIFSVSTLYVDKLVKDYKKSRSLIGS